MNRLLVLSFLIFSIVSCTRSQENTKSPAATQSQATQTTEQVQARQSAKPRSYYAQVTSRSKSEIEQDYPYNIELTNAAREKFNSKDVFKQNGKPTVLMFWLTTCVPCHYQMDAIEKKYAQWQEEADFNFYAISTDFQKNYDKFIAQNKKYNWEWEVYHDTNREFRLVMPGELNGLPQTFLLDKNGEIIFHTRKYRSGDEDVLFEKIKNAAKN